MISDKEVETMAKKFRKRDNTAFLTEQLLNVTDQEKAEAPTEAIEQGPAQTATETEQLETVPSTAKSAEISTEKNVSEVRTNPEKDYKNYDDFLVGEAQNFFEKYFDKNICVNKTYFEDKYFDKTISLRNVQNEEQQKQEQNSNEARTKLEKHPKMFRLQKQTKETKNKRVQLLVNDKDLEEIKQIAHYEEISVNELMNQLIKTFISQYYGDEEEDRKK